MGNQTAHFFERWIKTKPGEPESTLHGQTVQVVLVLVLCLTLWAEIDFARRGFFEPNPVRWANLAAGFSAIGSLILVRSGRFRSGVELFVWTFSLIMVVALLQTGFAKNQGSIMFAFLPLLTAGLVLRSCDTWLLTLLFCSGILAAIVVDLFNSATGTGFSLVQLISISLPRCLFIVVFSYLVDRLGRELRQSLEENTRERIRNERELRDLQNILPICSCCKKIRDGQGVWNQLESYLSEHAGVWFSHGLCSECLRKYYPEEPVEDSIHPD